MIRFLKTLLLAAFVAVLILISYWIGQQAYSWMPVQATAEAQKVDDIFSFLVSIGAFIYLGITGLILYSIFTCQAPRGDWSHGHPARSDVRLEILWTAVPTVLVLWIAFQSYNIYQQLNILGLTQVVMHHLPMEEPANAAVVDNSKIHGFYIPAFRFKQDIIPNRQIAIVISPTRIGKYRLTDSSFSGTYFALMQADVYVESPQAYNQWLKEAIAQKSTSKTNVMASNSNLAQ